jgi:uncharacterized membrane protein
MHKAILTLISTALVLSPAAFAAQEPVSGKSVMKLDDTPVRGARKALTQVNQEIARLDQQTQAAIYKAMPNDGLRSKQMETLANSYEMQKSDLLKERVSLEAAIQAE